MRKLKLVKSNLKEKSPKLFRCPVVIITLSCGEVIKRGCGRFGMSEFDAGWRCLYCATYMYKQAPSLESLWFHFRWAREFWKVHSGQAYDFVNGIPVTGRAEPLPSSCLSDLAEARPPRWFPYYLKFNDHEFREYMVDNKLC